MFYKFNESLTQIVEDTGLYQDWLAAYIYTEMQDREYMILSKDKQLLDTAYKMFVDVVESPSGSVETAFDEFDEFVKSNNLIFLDSEYNLEYSCIKGTVLNTVTGETYKVNTIYDYHSRF